jgi:hypothetical protein
MFGNGTRKQKLLSRKTRATWNTMNRSKFSFPNILYSRLLSRIIKVKIYCDTTADSRTPTLVPAKKQWRTFSGRWKERTGDSRNLGRQSRNDGHSADQPRKYYGCNKLQSVRTSRERQKSGARLSGVCRPTDTVSPLGTESEAGDTHSWLQPPRNEIAGTEFYLNIQGTPVDTETRSILAGTTGRDFKTQREVEARAERGGQEPDAGT